LPGFQNDDEMWVRLLPRVASLQSLNLSSTEIGDSGLASIAACFRNLTYLILLDNMVATAAGLQTHIPLLVSLQHLNLGHTKLSNAGLRAICQTLTVLEALDLSGCKALSQGFESMSSLGALQVLTADETRLGNKGLAVISSLPSLSYLSLSRCRKITPSGFECLSSTAALENLSLQRTKISHTSLCKAVGCLSRLSNLRLRGCHKLAAFHSFKFEEWPRVIPLTSLDVSFTATRGEGLKKICTQFTGLKHLNLESCTLISPKALFEHLPGLTSLQSLHAGGTLINDYCLSAIGSLPHLKQLSLSNCNRVSRQKIELLSIPDVSTQDLDYDSVFEDPF